MKKLSIKKNNEVVQHCNFESDEAMQAFIQLLADQAPWGKPERWLQDSPMSPLSEEEKAKSTKNRVVELSPEIPESVDEEGNVIPAIPAVMAMEYKFAAEYEVVIEDITAKIEAESAAKEAKRIAKEKRFDDLSKVDLAKVNSIAELKAIVKILMEEVRHLNGTL